MHPFPFSRPASWLARLAAAWLISAQPAPASAPSGEETGSYQAAIDLSREALRPALAKVPGASVAVAVDGRIVWSEAFGFADVATQRPATTATRFRIGSLSKPVTAAGLMRLAERGQLDLDAPIQRYVPDFPAKPEGTITPRLLAGHLAGIRHYRGQEPEMNQPFPRVRSSLRIFADDPLEATPGTKFNYSTYGWTLLSAAMESAAQREFLEFMATEVFEPLGMTRTRPDRAGADDADRTQFYEPGPDGTFLASPSIDSSYKWAGGGFLSTAEDVARFASAMLQPGYLNAESLTTLFTSQQTPDGQPTGYGIGWSLASRGRPIYFHGGGQQGCTSILYVRADAKLVVVILANISQSEIVGRARVIANHFAPVPAK